MEVRSLLSGHVMEGGGVRGSATMKSPTAVIAAATPTSLCVAENHIRKVNIQ